MTQKSRFVLELIDDPSDFRYDYEAFIRDNIVFLGAMEVWEGERWRRVSGVRIPISKQSLNVNGWELAQKIIGEALSELEELHASDPEHDQSLLYFKYGRPESLEAVGKRRRERREAAESSRRSDIPPTLIGEEDGGKSLL